MNKSNFFKLPVFKFKIIIMFITHGHNIPIRHGQHIVAQIDDLCIVFWVYKCDDQLSLTGIWGLDVRGWTLGFWTLGFWTFVVWAFKVWTFGVWRFSIWTFGVWALRGLDVRGLTLNIQISSLLNIHLEKSITSKTSVLTKDGFPKSVIKSGRTKLMWILVLLVQ